MPADMTGTRPCCSERRAIWPRSRNFDGTVHLIFQPSEEDISGAKRMIEEGLFKRFPCDAVFALHNMPGDAPGQVTVRPGPITAAVDIVRATIRGVAGMAPCRTGDGSDRCCVRVVMALQSIVARNIDPHDPAVVTVGGFNAGSLATVIPEEAILNIGVRTCTAEVRELMKRESASATDRGQAASFGCQAESNTGYGGVTYPAGVNSNAEAALIRETAIGMGQDPAKVDLRGPIMFSEDFAYMQEVRPVLLFRLRQWRQQEPSRSWLQFQRRASSERAGILGEAGRDVSR